MEGFIYFLLVNGLKLSEDRVYDRVECFAFRDYDFPLSGKESQWYVRYNKC